MATILVPIDGSECSYEALAKAGELARFYDATLLVVHVYNVVKAKNVFNEEKTIDKQAAMTQDAEAIVAQARRYCEEKGIRCEAKTLEGDPADRIVEYAAENDAVMIVMGSRGLTGLRRIVGSVTNKVLAAADRPVLVVQ